MNAAPPIQSPRDGISRWVIRGAAAALVLAALAAYHNSFSGPFVFDDRASITDNTTIRSLWPLGSVFSPPRNAGLGGRPVFNLTLAINYALWATNVWGYHAANLLIHILAGLTLFGIVRRTLLRGQVSTHDIAPRDVMSRDLTPLMAAQQSSAGVSPALPSIFLAFSAALLWTVDPLQTEAVTWVSGRAESLMGLFYLLTIYGFIRYSERSAGSSFVPLRGTTADEDAGRWRWGSLSFLACVFGMATKEPMVTAPVIVFLYDRTFVSGGFREAWRRHRVYYACLALTWIGLGRFWTNTYEQGVGLGLGGSWWAYALNESRVIVHYLRLAFWPHPLVFDYGSGVPAPTWAVLPDVIVVLALLVAIAWALCRKAPQRDGDAVLLRPASRDFGGRALGFAGACFFIILAPTSSVIAVAGQPMAEHRMYLPLAAVISAVVCGGCALVRRLRTLLRGQVSTYDIAPRDIISRDLTPSLTPWLLIAIAFICLTVRRNDDYRSDVALWSDTVSKRPDNARAQNGLGLALVNAGRLSAGIERYREALRLDPDYPEAHRNLGAALKMAGRIPEAVIECREALRLRPEDPESHYNLGVALQADGQLAAAVAEFSEALQLKPEDPDAAYNLGAALAQLGRGTEAMAHFEEALRLRPNFVDARYDLANALSEAGRFSEAIAQYQEVLRADPGDAPAHDNCGIALANAGRLAEAGAELREAVRLAPGRPDYHFNLGAVLVRQGNAGDARSEFERALQLDPDYGAARDQLNQLDDQPHP